MTTVTYCDIRPQLKTGDVLLFSGKGRVSDLIKWFTRSRYSHVGMVYCAEPDLVLCWESTTLTDVSDEFTRAPVRGVQLVPLSERVKRYTGEVWLRQLRSPLTSEQLHAIATLRRELHLRPYEERAIELIRAARDWGPWEMNEVALGSVFCSELLAETFIAAGLLSPHPPSNEYVPRDFSSEARLCLQGNELGPELRLVG